MWYGILAITLLTLIFVVVSIWFNGHDTRLIYRNLKKNREFDQVKQAQVENLAREILKANQLLIDCQSALDEKVDAFSMVVDEHKTYVRFQQEQFTELAKSDILAARRDELLRTKELKVALERLMGVAMTSRQPASPNDVIAIENLTNRIKELETIIENNSGRPMTL